MMRIAGRMRLGIAMCAIGLLGVATLPGAATAALTSGEFVVRCHYDHTNTDDPIVFPGQVGASHSHDFFGNMSTNANSTYASMTTSSASTSCVVADDTAGYWMPTPSIPPNGVFHANGTNGDIRAYYTNGIASAPETIPRDTQMVAGDAHATGPQSTARVFFYCGADSSHSTPQRNHPYNCQPY